MWSRGSRFIILCENPVVPLKCFDIFVKNQLTMLSIGSIYGLLTLFHWYIYLSLCQHHTYLINFILIRECRILQYCSSFVRLLCYSRPLHFHRNIKMAYQFLKKKKKPGRILFGIALNLVINWEKNDFLNNIVFQHHEHCMSYKTLYFYFSLL